MNWKKKNKKLLAFIEKDMEIIFFWNHGRVSSFVSLVDNEDLLAFACRAVAPTGFLEPNS